MTKPESTKRVGLESTFGGRGGQDLAEAVREQPRIVADRSHFLDLVQADYRRLSAEGAAWEPTAYCDHLGLDDSALLASVRRLVEVEKYFVENPSFLDGVGEPVWPGPGDSFAGFNLIEELGRGAASRVFLARDPARGDRKVALKVTTLATGEADLLGRADHRGVVPIHWHGSVEGSGLHWLCMPYHGRRTLQDEIDNAGEGGLASERVLQIGAQIAGTLAGLSKIGVFHGDLKPSNVLLLDNDQPMLIDFNLSRIDTAPSALVGGTLPYMAPEVLRRIVGTNNGPAPVVAAEAIASDVFSFGCLLFQLEKGHLWVEPKVKCASSEGLALAMLDAQLDASDEIPSALGDVAKGLSALLASCLALSPPDRPSGFAEIEVELRRLATREASRIPSWRRLGFMAAALVIASSCGIYFASGPTAVETIFKAEQFLEAGAVSEAAKALASLTDSETLPIDARWSLAKGFLAVGRHSDSADAFKSIGAANSDPMAYALAGYSFHLLGSHGLAIECDRKAMVLGEDSVAVSNNLAAGLLNSLGSRFDADASSEISVLLTAAACQEPLSPAVCVNILRHAEILSPRQISHRYPIADLLVRVGPCDKVDFLVLGAKHAASTAADDSALAKLGLDLLQRLAAIVPAQDIPNMIGVERYDALTSTSDTFLPDLKVQARTAYVAEDIGSIYIDPSEAPSR